MARVRCILNGSFEDALALMPDAGVIDNEITIEAESPAAAIAALKLDPEQVDTLILNGQYLDEADWHQQLASGSVLRLWPRLAGG